MEESCHRYVVAEAAEERCSKTLALHREWWAPANVEMKKRGSARSGKRLGESPGGAVALCSRAGSEVEERSSMVG